MRRLPAAATLPAALAADHLADIRNTRQITAVILRGRVLDRAAFDGLLARAAAQGASRR